MIYEKGRSLWLISIPYKFQIPALSYIECIDKKSKWSQWNIMQNAMIFRCQRFLMETIWSRETFKADFGPTLNAENFKELFQMNRNALFFRQADPTIFFHDECPLWLETRVWSGPILVKEKIEKGAFLLLMFVVIIIILIKVFPFIFRTNRMPINHERYRNREKVWKSIL